MNVLLHQYNQLKMKLNLILASLFACVVSCKESEGERMLREYQQENVKAMNFELKDLDFEILNVERTKDIIASDSMAVLKKQLAELWIQNPEQSIIDTLSFGYVKSQLNSLIADNDSTANIYHKITLMAISSDNVLLELDAKNKVDKAMSDKVEYEKVLIRVEKIEKKFTTLAERPDSVLSVIYSAKYRIKNPMLNNSVQTFNKLFYTNTLGNAFVKDEIVE